MTTVKKPEVEQPIVEGPKAEQLPTDLKMIVIKKMAEIEKEYGQPSDIPLTHEYWQLKRQLLVLQVNK